MKIFREYKKFGFQIVIDDFGAGYSSLTLLVDFQLNLTKLDMALVWRMDTDSMRRHVARDVLAMCLDLGIWVIAEGLQTCGEDFRLVVDWQN